MFASIVAELEGVGSDAWTHGTLEDHLGRRSRELMRRLYQDHLDLRAANEQHHDDIIGADRVARTRTERGHQRVLSTVFGDVTVTRNAYRAPKAVNLYPADDVLNLPHGKHSDGLAKLAVTESVRGSFDTAIEAITRATGVVLGKPQILDLVAQAAVDVPGFYAARRPSASPDTDVLVMTNDGKGIRMRPDGLRETTRKAAASSSNKLATRLSPGEKSGRKRMAELGAVYDITPVPRVAADIIASPTTTTTVTSTPRPDNRKRQTRGKWLTASITDDIPTVIATTFDEATRRDPDHRRVWIALVDGNNQQIQAITAEATRRGKTVTIVIDFIHVLEYLWTAAWSFFDKGDPDVEAWVATQATTILKGRSNDVAAGIRRRATRFGYSTTERKGADDAATYLTNKKPYLNYATALESGWPIATGIIEGACRHLVKDRFDITGARWGLDGAHTILTLRALTINGDLEEYWAYHLLKEHYRRHETRYTHQQNDYILAG
ncbi:ISKra4 family transposase [Amycolatopsis sp. H20-H5]|uniref:ISKra4 family transposase n=1 Tax=Amycolatopsis sp. H20-H5 TaxID=3046309 RepID=UPI003FA3B145